MAGDIGATLGGSGWTIGAAGRAGECNMHLGANGWLPSSVIGYPRWRNAVDFSDKPLLHDAVTHSRATVAPLCRMFNGDFYEPIVGEVGSHGMRRVRGIRSAVLSENLGHTANAVVSGFDVQLTTADLSYHYLRSDTAGAYLDAGTKVFARCQIACAAGTRTIGVRLVNPGDSVNEDKAAVTVGVDPVTVTLSITMTVASLPDLGIDNRAGVVPGIDSSAGTFTITEPMIWVARPGQTIPDPEHIDSATDYGWGAPGVRCFDTDEYGNDLTIGLGPQRLLNGAFDTDTGWIKSAGWSIANGVATYDGTGGTAALSQVGVVVIGKTYKIEFDVVSNEGVGVNNVYLGNTGQVNGTGAHLPAGHYSFTGVAAGNTSVYIYGQAGEVLVVDNFSVREVYPVKCAGAVRHPAVTNLFEYANPSAGAPWIGPQEGNVTAGGAIGGLPRSLKFGSNSALSYAYRTNTLTGDHVLQVLVQMDDFSAPVVGTSSTDSSLDFVLNVEGATTGLTPSVDSLGGGLYRAWVKHTCTGILNNYGLLKYTGNSAKGFRVLLMQVHAGTKPRPFVLTSGATKAASADISQADAAAFGYLVGGGVFAMDVTCFADVSDSPYSQLILHVVFGSAWLRVYDYNGSLAFLVDDGTRQVQIEGGTWTVGVSRRIVVRLEANNASMWIDGAKVGSTDLAVSVPDLRGQIEFGDSSFWGAYKRFYYFSPGTVTDAQALAMSGGDLPLIPELA